MDDRTTQIKEGAGLEESRINKEFVELLQKWSSPVLLVLAIIVGLYAGNNFLKQRKNDRINEAYRQHAEITETASPAPQSLSAVAAEYDDVQGVGLLAKLRHADVLLLAVRTGVQPGAEFETDENGAPNGRIAEGDALGDDDAQRYLDQARDLYQAVADEAGEEIGQQTHRISALFGLASVAETAGDPEAAIDAYTRAEEAAEIAGFPVFVALASSRAQDAASFVSPVSLYNESELPEIPEPEPPAGIVPQIDESLLEVGPAVPDNENAEDGGETATDSEADTGAEEETETEAGAGDENAENGNG